MNNVITKLKVEYVNMSKGHKKIADFVIAQYEKAAFMTAEKLSMAVNVSESTVVRFAVSLGFGGYGEFQEALQEAVKNRLTSNQRIEVVKSRFGDKDILESVMQSDLEKIKKTIESVSRESFNNSINDILNARNIYILGIRSSSALASFLGFYLNLLFGNVRIISTTSVSEVFEQIMRIGEQDVLIGISFPRYSYRTAKAVKYASTKGAKVIAITDSTLSPIVKYSKNVLIAKSDMASFVDSLVAPLSLVNALIVALGASKAVEAQKDFELLEQIWKEYKVYDTDEENV